MTEFTTGATIDVTVSPDSLREARGTIEDELGDVQVDVSSVSGGNNSGGRMAGRERAMGRQLQSKTNEHLSGIDNHWTENLDLNRERNDLLRQLLDVNEKDAQTTRGRGGSLAGGAIGLAIGGIGLGAMLLDGLGSKLSDAIPELNPAEIVSSVSVGVSDVIDSAASVGAGNVISSAVSLSPAALIASKAAVTASDLIGSPANISPSNLIAEAATVSPSTLVATAATITVSSVIATAATINPGNVISATVDLAPNDIISGTISASAIADRVTDPDSSPDGGDGGIDPKTIIGGGAAAGGAYGAIRQIGKGGASRLPQIGRGSAGLSTPVITRRMTGLGPNEVPDLKNGGTKKKDLKSNREWITDLLSGPADPNAGPTAADDPNQWKTSPARNPTPSLEDASSGSITTAKAEQTNNFEIIAPIDDLEREARNRFDEVDRRLSKLEEAFQV